jgi:hypothetical protein
MLLQPAGTMPHTATMSPTNFLAELRPCMVDDAQNRASLFLPVNWFCLGNEFDLWKQSLSEAEK